MADYVRDVGGMMADERHLLRGGLESEGGGGGRPDAFGRDAPPYRSGGGRGGGRGGDAGMGGPQSVSSAGRRSRGGGHSALPVPAGRDLPVLDGGDDGRSYGAASEAWGPGGDATYAGAGTYASAYRSTSGSAGGGGGGGGAPDRGDDGRRGSARGGSRGGGAQRQQQQQLHGSYGLSGPGGTRGRSSRALREEHVRQLVAQGFSNGLARALAQNAMSFDHRIWVVDNSGSMQIGDGHRIVETGGAAAAAGGSGGRKGKDGIRAIPSTRWEEIQDTVRYHAEMAALLDSPTIFKLLNDPGSDVGPQQFSVAERGEARVSEDIGVATETMKRAKPGGVTPLTRHIWEIQQSIQDMKTQLNREGKKIVVVLATDGLPTDEQGYGGEYITNEFIRALRSLEGLPVWLVVRLCTDEEPVTRFYNNLDGQLELSLEVLDDFIGEAHEVYRHNKWLNYALPMHRCRELGYHDRLFDLIDERPLTQGEIRDFCALLFGVDGVDGMPDPGADWQGFVRTVQTMLRKEQLQWNPIKKKMTPWINVKVLNKQYGNRTCSVM